MAWIFQTDGNYVNFNGGGNLWRLHKDSACITWHWDQSGDLFFDVYGQEYTVKAANIADVIIDGVPLSAASGFGTAIRAVFTGLGGGGGVESYLVYTALLTQSGTDAPVVAAELRNTLGFTPTFTREAPGEYTIVKSGGWDSAKTWFAFQPCDAFNDNSCLTIQAEIISDGPIVNQIYFTTRDVSAGASDWGGGQGNTKLPIEIRIYP